MTSTPPASGPADDSSPSPQVRSISNAHAPLIPSGLRQSYEPGSSPETERSLGDRSPGPGTSPGDHQAAAESDPAAGTDPDANGTRRASVNPDGGGIEPAGPPHTSSPRASTERPVRGILDEPEDMGADAAVQLAAAYHHMEERACGCPPESCEHGNWSPRAPTLDDGDDGGSATSKSRGGGGGNGSDGDGSGGLGQQLRERFRRVRTASIDDVVGGVFGERRQLDTTRSLAEQIGVKHGSRLYLGYYFPFMRWIGQYRWSFFQGDVVAALTMASFYIPMALSYAENLAHVPPINGLYAFVFNPLIYAFLGTVPRMVVGPEAPGSLLVGTVVVSSIEKGHTGDEESMMHARIAGVVTGMAGAIILVAGLTRLGFLENVLSRPFLRGFISAIGIVIFVDQLIPEMGLMWLAKDLGADHASSWGKFMFLIQNFHKAHGATTAISFSAFAIIMVCRQTKNAMQSRRPWVAYIPDRFVVVVMSAVFAYLFDWESMGVEIMGEIRSGTGRPFPIRFPFVPSYMHHVREALSTSFIIALLGFFESSVAAKSLGEPKPGEGIRGLQHSANRELVALGVANIIGGCFMALPAFGGYGRSKVNSSTGGRTGMSSVLLSLFTAICIFFLLPYFYYLPKGVLSAMVSVVAYSLIEECPHDIRFFLQIRGWQELILMFIIAIATILYSLTLGIALGMGLSLLAVVRHATKPRIQILGKVPHTADRFENAETNPHDVEFIEGSLIVKIPEPLTFANTGDLRSRLRRLERYGTMLAHPALPAVRPPEHNQNVVFDVHGVTSIDGSGAQVLSEIVAGYVDAGVRVFFCRVPHPRHPVFRKFIRSGIVEKCGGMRHFVMSVEEALALAAESPEEQQYRDQEEPPV